MTGPLIAMNNKREMPELPPLRDSGDHEADLEAWGLTAAKRIVQTFEEKQRAERLLELYAQEQARTDEILERLLDDLRFMRDGHMDFEQNVDDIIDQLETWSAGRQVRDTWR